MIAELLAYEVPMWLAIPLIALVGTIVAGITTVVLECIKRCLTR